MQQLLKQLRSAILAALGIAVLVAAPVAAKDGISSTSGGSSSDTSISTSTTTMTTEPKVAEPETETHTETSTSSTTSSDDSVKTTPLKISELRSKAQLELETERKDKPVRTVAARQKTCTEHQTDINNRITNLGNNAQKHLDRFTETLMKVEAFQTKNKLPATNYETLLATATADQTAATNAVAALKSITVTIDCNSTDPATTVATVKGAANNAKTALQTFRTDIKAIITALQAAKSTTTESTTTTGTN